MNHTVIFADTYTPSIKELRECPHIVLSSPHKWDPLSMQFHLQSHTLQDKMQLNYNVSEIDCQYDKDDAVEDSPSTIFDIASINNRIISSESIKYVDSIGLSDRKISSIEDELNWTQTK